MPFLAVSWRIWVVIVLLFLFGLARRLYRQWRERLAADHRAVPTLPAAMVNGSERTWVVFSTPLCASCGPIEDELRAAEPQARVVRVDATRDATLASAFRVRSAPTVLLADGHGRVQTRLVGAGAVRQYLAEPYARSG